jgi:hypothetical protein
MPSRRASNRGAIASTIASIIASSKVPRNSNNLGLEINDELFYSITTRNDTS